MKDISCEELAKDRKSRRGFLASVAASALGSGLLMAGAKAAGAASAISSTNPAQNLQIFCVTDPTYGAIINNDTSSAVTTTTAAIQQAINDCGNAGGGVVYFPPGSYYVNSTLSVGGNGVTLQGGALGASYINGMSSFTGTDLIYVGNNSTTNGPSCVWLKDLVLGANMTSPTNNVHFQCTSDSGCDGIRSYNTVNGILFDGFSGCKLNNVQSFGNSSAGDGVIIHGQTGQNWGADLWIGGGSQMSNNLHGIHITGDAGGVQIEDADILGNSWGIVLDNSFTNSSSDFNREIFIGHCFIDSSQYDGLYVGTYGADTLHMTGTWCCSHGLATTGGYANSGNGIEISLTQTSTMVVNIAGCRIFNSMGSGVVASSCRNINISGSSIDGNGRGSSGGHGIALLNSDIKATSVTGNMITNNGNSTLGAAVCIQYEVSDIIVTSNNTLGNGYTSGGSAGAGVQFTNSGSNSNLITGLNL